jgi:hypothetical protein
VKGHGWCNLHYQRWASNGDPLVTRPSQRPRTSVYVRLAARLDRADPDGCWPYQDGHPQRSGHVQIWDGDAMRLVHRVAWQEVNGPIPDGMCVCHRCDNPPCCNPAHLFLGTVADNNADRDRKGRGVMPPASRPTKGRTP